MIVFDISEPRYMFMEYLKQINVEYSPDLFLKFLSGSLFRICGPTVEIDPVSVMTKYDLIVSNISHLDVVLTKWFPMDYISQIRLSGYVGDYYIVKIVGNTGDLYHVSEYGAVHHTV